MRASIAIFSVFILVTYMAGCAPSTSTQNDKMHTPSKPDEKMEQSLVKPADKGTIKLATTTSCDNSGLLKQILPDFINKTGISVDVIAVGTGKALQHGKDGDVDVILVHAPASEKKYIEEGWATDRHYVCQNEFVITGPESDPAGLKTCKTAVEALKKLTEGKAKFISRGDDSGTHKREKSIWEAADIEPSGDWYISAGQGMGAVLTMANESDAYALTDTGTYYAMIDKLDLKILFKGDALLDNIYSVLLLNPVKHPDLKHAEAAKFIEWLTSDETGKMISSYEVNGHVLFSVK